MNILSQAKTPDGILTEWANTRVGFSPNLIHAKGSAVVLLAEIMDVSPLEVNEKLKSVGGFNEDQIIWEKVMVAFPGWAAQFITPYNNQAVLDALSNGQFVIVLTDSGHALRYMGNGLCHDPKDGTLKSTSIYPNVQACIILTHIPEQPEGTLTPVEPPVETPKESPPIEKSQEAKNGEVLKRLKKIRLLTREINNLLSV